MCGIFGYMGERADAATLVLSGLDRLEPHTYDAWGIAVEDHGHIAIGTMTDADTPFAESHMALGHTRSATHGDAPMPPQLDCAGRLAVVHDGVVSNEAQLRIALARAGHRLRSQTDTELIAHLIEDLLEQLPEGPDRLVQATIAAFRKLRGLNAVSVLDVRRGELVACQSGAALCVGFADDGYLLASDHRALHEHTQLVSFLRDGQAVSLTREGARIFEMTNGQELAPEITRLDRSPGTSSAPPSTPRDMLDTDDISDEIVEQPALLRWLAERAPSQVRDLAMWIDRAHDVYMIGCGSSGHAAHVAQYLFARAGRRAHYVTASEFSYLYPFLSAGSLVIALSRSGETAEVLSAVSAAHERGAKVAAITHAVDSSLWRAADFTLPLAVGEGRCPEAMRSMSAQLAMLLLTACAMDRQLDAARDSLCRAADDIERLLGASSRQEIQAIAEALQTRDHLYVLGRGANHALALETALKIKESSHIHAEGFAGGELKHGGMALIEPRTPCIVLAPRDETHADMLANALQLKARGATVIGIAAGPESAFDHCIRVNDVGPATVITHTVPGRLLGYELARLRGRTTTMPRPLAKCLPANETRMPARVAGRGEL